MQDKLLNRMAEFIQLERDLRAAPSEKALGFVLTNYLRKLLSYEVSLLVSSVPAAHSKKLTAKLAQGGQYRVVTVSGVSEFDDDAPLIQFTSQVVNHPDIQLHDSQMHNQETLPTVLRQSFSELEFSQLVTVKMDKGNAVLVLYRDSEWQLSELQLLQQVSDVASHALRALQRADSSATTSRFRNMLANLLRPNWRWVVCGMIAVSFLPIRQSVIASGEVAPVSPTVVAAGLDAVVKRIYVAPNQNVVKDQVLLEFDSSSLKHQRSSVHSELELAREKLRKARQQSLNTTLDGNVFSELETQIELKQLELEFVDEQMSRLQVRATRDGIVLFTRKKDWEGRAVMTGEKIMEIAGSNDNQFEIWLAANDAIDLEKGSSVRFFPDADPLKSVDGEVSQVGYFAASSESSDYAYRVVASSNEANEHADVDTHEDELRLGMKGTFRLYGKEVSLAYHLFRKPLSAVRRTLGV